MSVAQDFAHTQEWTPARLSAFLDEEHDGDVDWRRFEILDGMLVVSPQPDGLHAAVVDELVAFLRANVPVSFRASSSRAVAMGRSYRVPDAVVARASTFQRGRIEVTPLDLLLVVEVESPSSVTPDRITKPAQYAAAGIEHYWRVELDPLRLITYALDGAVYVETDAWGAGETATIIDPFPVTIDLASLLR